MSAPASIASTQNSALQALQKHKPHGNSAASSAPSQLQVSFANLVGSLNGSSAAQSAGGALQVNAVGGVSSTDSLDMASLIEAVQASGSGDGNAVQGLQAHRQRHGPHQASGLTDAGSSAVSAYSAMAAPAGMSTPGLSTRV
ncbi:MAG TPA: hypothetical protein VF798_00595 [Burkholderiaceae bacterium]